MTARVEAEITAQSVVRAMLADGEFAADVLIMLAGSREHVEWGRVEFELGYSYPPDADGPGGAVDIKALGEILSQLGRKQPGNESGNG
jgi:hypothetical protein